jgi:MinD superfamily P-loop ATPase
VKNSSQKLKQLVILSGKGGTGKTSLCAAIAHLTSVEATALPAVFADADVDAANFHMMLQASPDESGEFRGSSLAEIDAAACSACGACERVCRYDAVIPGNKPGQAYKIDPMACDGCAACVYACPEEAIRMVQQQDGQWFRSSTPYGVLFHAELLAGKENSGKLVTLVKQLTRLHAEEHGVAAMIVDGPPGIGCPVISACSGADLALVVTEPGLAGLHDMQRVLQVLEHFKVPALLCINKADIFPEGARRIRQFAVENALDICGEIPFDDSVIQAVLSGEPVTQVFPDSPAAAAIRGIWQETARRLFPPEI